ncbi:fimbrial protein [Providencia vermicola]|uniref:fimbrial protein n=1 Tax=Providencia TaxID=586 RepID=UPI0012B5DF45|nr:MULTISPECIES: hypothetical protein [unclassified Providencia]MTB39575.1 hypothetical protein [Providencia sp. wls1949]MTC07955.1 hypothetical protein [Providencia sp. wls1948]
MAIYVKNSKLRHSILLVAAFFSTVSVIHADTQFEVKGNIIKGSCAVSASSMTVEFPMAIQTNSVKSELDDKTHVQPFELKYTCDSFDLSGNAGAPYNMVISLGTGTSVTQNNKIYPTNNVTNGAFVLYHCDESKQNCQIVDINSGGLVPFTVKANGESLRNFEVAVVKLDAANSLVPGPLLSAVDIVLEQP